MRAVLLSLCACTLLAACVDEGNHREVGYEALQDSDYASAVSHLDKALASSEASPSEVVEMAVARCQALAHIDSARCTADFLAISESGPSDFSIVVSELLDEEEFIDAIDLLVAGIERFPETPAMELLKIEVIARSKDDPDASDVMKGHQYF